MIPDGAEKPDPMKGTKPLPFLISDLICSINSKEVILAIVVIVLGERFLVSRLCFVSPED